MIVPDLISQITDPLRFDERPVDQGTVMSILEAARLAPSANNSQIWRFFVIRDETHLRKAADLAGKAVFSGARTIVAACAEPWIVGRRGKEQPFFMIDVPIALTHIILAARESGVSASLSFEFDEDRLIALLGAPRGYRPVALIALGYAQEDRPRPDESHEDIVHII
jgi:nitroreductase